jgi:hypothetical protein
VHSDAQKDVCGLGVLIEHVADDVVLCNSHNDTSVILGCDGVFSRLYIF